MGSNTDETRWRVLEFRVVADDLAAFEALLDSLRRVDGDTAQARAAAGAMQSSHDWKILREMQRDGAWSQVLWNYADAMTRRDTSFNGHPLQAEVRGGLGCAPAAGG